MANSLKNPVLKFKGGFKNSLKNPRSEVFKKALKRSLKNPHLMA